MSKKKLFKSKTNFTLKRLHQSGSFGNIYERDYTTIANTGAVPEGQIPIYNSPSFKLSVRAGYNGQKKYNYGNWSNNPVSNANIGDIVYWDGSEIKTIAPTNWVTTLGTAIGVIYGTYTQSNTKYCRIVSLDKAHKDGQKWCASSSISDIEGIKNKTADEVKYEYNGSGDTKAIVENTKDGNYAAHLAWKYNGGVTGTNVQWFLPSAGELYLLLSNLETINATLTLLGAHIVTSAKDYPIWTSSEKDANIAYYIENGEILEGNKSSKHAFIRPCAIIEAKSSECTSWTLDTIPPVKRSDTKIVLKPNSRRLTDFACYGSAVDLIKSSLTDIIARFPAELYVTDKKYNGYNIIDNPLAIDIIQGAIPENSTFSPLRYFCKSFDKYETNGQAIYDWQVTSNKAPACLTNGDYMAKVTIAPFGVIHCYYHEDSVIYVTDVAPGTSIRPNAQAIAEFFDSLDDFEKVLLNQYTDYTATFECYVEDDDSGWYMGEKQYQWPLTEGNWNISIGGRKYNDYLDSLAELAMGYDELYTNSIWRSMTHEAISNMDLTLTRNDDDIEIPNSSKVKQTLSIIGRQFDEIKKYADTIKNSNSITYTQDGNTPDYFLSDNLELSGWESKEIFSNVPNDIVTPPMYGARTIGYNAGDANAEFMRRLKLNTRGIFSKKGTKQGIEDLMAVFGYHSVDWIKRYIEYNGTTEHPDGNFGSNLYRKSFLTIEYVYVVDSYAYNKTGEEMRDEVLTLNQIKDSFTNEDVNGSDLLDIDPYQGLPVAEVTYDNKTQLIPWFDKNVRYDGNPYFQMKGGWSRNDGDRTLDPTPNSVYEKSVSKIHYVETIDDLLDLSYNTLDINGIYYVGNEGSYYKIIDINEHQDAIKGWKLATNDEITEAENIIDYNKGNNPHTGEYDGGLTYLEMFGQLFKNSTFNNAREEDISERFKLGFNTTRQADSTKCLFFGKNNSFSDVALRGENKIKPADIFNEEEESYAEQASLSVINSKELHIIFDKAHKEFLEENVLPYVKQMIPSSTIFSYSFEVLGEDFNSKYEARTHKIICNGDICPIFGVS